MSSSLVIAGRTNKQLISEEWWGLGFRMYLIDANSEAANFVHLETLTVSKQYAW